MSHQPRRPRGRAGPGPTGAGPPTLYPGAAPYPGGACPGASPTAGEPGTPYPGGQAGGCAPAGGTGVPGRT
ncbi:hypothetical protein E1091_14575, partial [Micromonospora fluostatini]